MNKNLDFKTILDKLNLDKKSAIIILVGIVGLALIIISELVPTESDKEKNEFSGLDNFEYCEVLENEISEMVSSINGAGKTKVMITLAETTEYIYAKDSNDNMKRNDTSQNSDSESNFVIIEKDNNDSGLLLKTIEPKVKGVAIVCEGGDDAKIQQEIYSMVSAVLNISTARISISKLTQSKE